MKPMKPMKRLPLTGVGKGGMMTPMTKTQVYLREEDLEALHGIAERTGRSVAGLMREAIRQVWLRPKRQGPVALWDGEPRRTAVEHDTIYDEP
jgi:Ribbon-helix-helix protein, copG family